MSTEKQKQLFNENVFQNQQRFKEVKPEIVSNRVQPVILKRKLTVAESVLYINCKKCDTLTKFSWCFEEIVILLSSCCPNCSEQFCLEKLMEKTANIITHPDFLPHTNKPYYDAFYHIDGNFHYYQLFEPDVPILELSKWTEYRLKGRRFTQLEEGLVKLSDIEDFINSETNENR